MSIKYFLTKLVARITGRKCIACHHNRSGYCIHPDGTMFARCWQSITRPGYECSESVHYVHEVATPLVEGIEAGLDADLTEEERHQMAKIVASLQEASETARDGGLLEE